MSLWPRTFLAGQFHVQHALGIVKWSLWCSYLDTKAQMLVQWQDCYVWSKSQNGDWPQLIGLWPSFISVCQNRKWYLKPRMAIDSDSLLHLSCNDLVWSEIYKQRMDTCNRHGRLSINHTFAGCLLWSFLGCVCSQWYVAILPLSQIGVQEWHCNYST